MLERLEDVPWENLSLLSEEPATLVPRAVRRLLDPRATEADLGEEEVFAGIANPINGVSECASYVIPFLYELLERPQTPHRAYIVDFLTVVLDMTRPDPRFYPPYDEYRRKSRAAVIQQAETLLACLTDAVPEVRHEAIILWAVLPEQRERVVNTLFAALGSEKSAKNRVALIEALTKAEIGLDDRRRSAVNSTVEAIAYDEGEAGMVRLTALSNAIEAGLQLTPGLLYGIKTSLVQSILAGVSESEWFNKLAVALVGQPEAFMEVCDFLLEHPDPSVRGQAERPGTWGFGKFASLQRADIYSDWVIKTLTRSLRHPDQNIRQAVLRNFVQVTQRGYEPPSQDYGYLMRWEADFAAAINDPLPAIRDDAVALAGYLRLPSALPRLIELLEAGEPSTLTPVLHALALYGEDASEALPKLLEIKHTIDSDSASPLRGIPGLPWQLERALKQVVPREY